MGLPRATREAVGADPGVISAARSAREAGRELEATREEAPQLGLSPQRLPAGDGDPQGVGLSPWRRKTPMGAGFGAAGPA